MTADSRRSPTTKSSTACVSSPSTEGIFAETAGGVTIATLQKLAADGVIRSDECVVVYITGHGLKTLEAVAPTTGPTATIEPNLDAFHEAFDLEETQ